MVHHTLLQGDTVQVKGGELYVNGKKVDEPYRNEAATYSWGPKTVPTGTVLVFGESFPFICVQTSEQHEPKMAPNIAAHL